MRDTVEQALLKGRLGPRVHIFWREGMLDRRGPLHMIAHHTVGLERHAIDDPRLVEMKMALNEARGHQLPAGIVGQAIRSKVGLDGNNDTVAHANIDCRMIRASTCKPGVANNEIQGHLYRFPSRMLRRPWPQGGSAMVIGLRLGPNPSTTPP